MLKKLFKYDFIWINKIMIIYYIILLVISILTKIVESMDQTFLLLIIDKILSSMFIGCAVSVIITTFMRIWARFLVNNYKDESYLTHTLPVTKNQIFNSKILAGIISILISTLVIVGCIALIYLNANNWEYLKTMFESLVQAYSKFTAISYIVGLIVLVILELFYIMFAGILGLVIGHRSNNHKMLKSILFGFISYVALLVLSFITVGITSNFTDSTIIYNGFPPVSTMKAIGLTFVIVYIIYNIGHYLIAKHLFNKGINVE